MRSEMNAGGPLFCLPRRRAACQSRYVSAVPQLRGCCQIGRVSGYSAREREASEARQPFPISCSIHGLPHGMHAQSLRLLLMCNCAKAAPHHPSFRKHQAFASSSYITRSGTTPDRGNVRQPPPPPRPALSNSLNWCLSSPI